MAVASGNGTELVTHSLGSCLGVAIYDPVARVGGLLHAMLPDSSLNPKRARKNPEAFVDTGLPRLFKAAYALGAEKRRIKVVIAGGAQVVRGAGVFGIGKRNYAAARKMLWRNNVLVHAEDVGGSISRTVYLSVGAGEVRLTLGGKEKIGLLMSSQPSGRQWTPLP